jgi:hypothetical protein
LLARFQSGRQQENWEVLIQIFDNPFVLERLEGCGGGFGIASMTTVARSPGASESPTTVSNEA